MLRVLIIAAFLYGINCRNAIDYFVKRNHNRLKNFTMEIIKNTDNSSTNWIEYKYIFSDDLILKSNSTLRIGLFLNKSYEFDCASNENQTDIKGYSIDIVESIKESLNNVSLSYVYLDTISNLSESLSSEIDLLICHPTLHQENLNPSLIQLYPTINTNLVLVYKPSKLTFTKDIFILTFAGSLWLVFFVVLILLAVCLRISTVKYSMIPPKHQSWTWVEITLWAIAAACQQGLSHTPSGFASCMIFFLGYLMAYLLYTGFAAAITSILVQHDVDSNFNLKTINPEKLRLISLTYLKPEIASFKLKYPQIEYVDDIESLFLKLEKQNRVGIAPGLLLDQFLADFDYSQVSLYLISKLNLKHKNGFIIARNNTWRETINHQILAMQESGILQNMLKRNLKIAQIPDLNTGYSSAGQEHVGSAILLFLGGVCASIVFLMAEFIFYFYKRSKNHLGL